MGPGRWVGLVAGLVFDEFVVGSWIHKRIELSGIANANLQKPRLAIRGLIDDFWRVDRSFVALDDLASDGGVDIRSGLDRLDHAQRFSANDAIAHVRELEIRD